MSFINVHYYRARGLLDAGKIDEAQKEIHTCLRLLPGSEDVPLFFVPALEKLGRKKEAGELFSSILDTYGKLIKDYPDWAQGHNQLAWLCARCRRQLDEALAHAQKATTLEPKHAGYLDTLAEVHFQRGDKEQAIELMKKCIALEPKKEYFQKQLKRFEAGDPKVEVPE